MNRQEVATFVGRGDYAGLKRILQHADLDSLCHAWGQFEPMQKVVIFKLMNSQVAMNFYQQLSFLEKYFLFSAFDLGSIAPVIEDLPSRTRALFHRLSGNCYDKMFQGMLESSHP